MNRLAAIATAVAALGAGSSALAIPIMDKGVLNVGDTFLDGGSFNLQGNNMFGARFTINVNVTVGSGYGMIIDSFGSESDSELALYDTNGEFLFAINDDGGVINGVPSGFDSYLGFGDAAQADAGTNLQGSTNQSGSGFANAINLLAGTYVMVIGPYNTTWDELDVDDSVVDNQQRNLDWECRLTLFQVPTPASMSLLACGVAAFGTRRRRS